MSAVFVSASSRYLLNSAAPFTAPPFTIGMWMYPTVNGATTTTWALMDGASATQNGFVVGTTATNVFSAFTIVNGVPSAATSVAAQVLSSWHFVVARFISTSNRRLSVLIPGGAIDHSSSAGAATPAVTPSRQAIGAQPILTPATFFNGNIGEWWSLNADVQADGLQLTDATVRLLARDGPFSLPHIAKDIVDYRSLRYALGSDQDAQPDYFSGNKGRQTWVNTNGVIISAHPPLLAPQYRGPNDVRRLGVV